VALFWGEVERKVDLLDDGLFDIDGFVAKFLAISEKNGQPRKFAV